MDQIPRAIGCRNYLLVWQKEGEFYVVFNGSCLYTFSPHPPPFSVFNRVAGACLLGA